MLALADYEAGVCEGCGQHLDDTLTTEAEDWEVPPPLRCAACTRIGIEMDGFTDTKSAKNQHVGALRWRAVLKRLKRPRG